MQFTTGIVTRCDGGNHYTMPITIGGTTRNLEFTAQDLQDADNNFESRKAQILLRLAIAIKESGANTLQEVRAAINNKTFMV